MLTKGSFVAINQFLPSFPDHMKSMKGNLQVFYKHLHQCKPHYEVLSDDVLDEPIQPSDLSDETFIDDHLKKDILRLKNHRRLVFTTSKTVFTLDIYHKGETLDLFLDTLMYALTLTTLVGPHTVKDVHMNYYLLDVKRVLDGDNILDKEEVNGGSCMTSSNRCDISVWRKEEVLKVSIHELIHGLSYDYRDDPPDIIKHYQDKYGISSDKMSTYEAYTEIFAELIHCYVLSFYFKMVNSSIDQYMLFIANVGIEILFSSLQANKVLALAKTNSDMNKHTNVCAYYVIKMELYQNLNNFLRFCKHHNKDFIKVGNVELYLDYLKKVGKVVGTLNVKATGHLRKVTRMTCLEIDLF